MEAAGQHPVEPAAAPQMDDRLRSLLWQRAPVRVGRVAPRLDAFLANETWLADYWGTELVIVSAILGAHTAVESTLIFTMVASLAGAATLFFFAFFSRYLGLAYAIGYLLGDLTSLGKLGQYHAIYASRSAQGAGGIQGVPSVTGGGERLPFALGWPISRLIVYALLFTIVLVLPALAEELAIHLGWMKSRRLRTLITESQMRTHLLAAVIVLLLFFQAAPLIVRGVFLVAGASPPAQALLRSSEGGTVLLTALLGLLLRYRLAVDPLVVVTGEGASLQVRVYRAAGGAALITLLFTGLYSSWSDIIVAVLLALLVAASSNGLVPLSFGPGTAAWREKARYVGALLAVAVPLVLGIILVPSSLTGNTMHRIVLASLGGLAVVVIVWAVVAGRSTNDQSRKEPSS